MAVNITFTKYTGVLVNTLLLSTENLTICADYYFVNSLSSTLKMKGITQYYLDT
jgi:hypothetical protein